MWIFWTALSLAVLLWLGIGKKPKAGSPNASRIKARHVFSAADLIGMSPITNQTTACKALRGLLTSAGYAQTYKSVLTETIGDFKEAMRDHQEALQSDIEDHQGELAYEQECHGTLSDDEDDDESDRAELERVRARIRALQETLRQDKEKLKKFKADRAEFVAAFANHVLHDMPTPNRAQQHTLHP